MLSGLAILFQLVAETLRWCRLTFRSSRSIKAENLFLRMLTTFCIGVAGWTYFKFFETRAEFKRTTGSEEGYWASTALVKLIISRLVAPLARLFIRQK